jgi:hypothetical protein
VDGLRDKKDIVEVTEYSFETLIAVIVFSLILFAIFVYLYKNRRIRRKKPTKKELALKRLKSIDFDDVKSAVYSFSVDGFLFTDDSNIDEFKKIEDKLKGYKYQKDIPLLENSTKEMMREFIKGLK